VDYRYFERDYSHERFLLPIEDVIGCIDDAVRTGKPYSLARFGHAEIAELRMSTEYFQRMVFYRDYNGVTTEDVRVELIKALTSATTVGIIPSFIQLSGAEKSVHALRGLRLGFYTICSAWITHRMTELPYFWDWLKQYRVALVGRRAEEAAPVFQKHGVEVSAKVHLEGIQQLETAYEQLMRNDAWQVAILAAGVPATILAPRIANATDKVAIDFGHALDLILDGEDFDFENLVRKLRGSQ